jgi:hypothetical protein
VATLLVASDDVNHVDGCICLKKPKAAGQDLLLALGSKESACRSTQHTLTVNHPGCQVQGIYLTQCKQKVSLSVGNKPGLSNAIS